jgi:hypothetical protein
MKSRVLFSILMFLLLNAGCGSKDLHLTALVKQLSEIKMTALMDNNELSNNLQKYRALNRSKIQPYFEADSAVNNIAERFTSPSDSNFYSGVSEKEIKELYDSTISRMYKPFQRIARDYLIKRLGDYLKQPVFYELSSDKQARMFNIICNQLSILAYQKKLQKQLLCQISTPDYVEPSPCVFDNGEIK